MDIRKASGKTPGGDVSHGQEAEDIHSGFQAGGAAPALPGVHGRDPGIAGSGGKRADSHTVAC